MLLIRKKKPRTDPPRPPEPPIPVPDPDAIDWSDVTLPPVPTRRPRRAATARGRAAQLWLAIRRRP